jgi:hypothetical protein
VVRFQYYDYAGGKCTKEMTLAAGEFLRRFLLHVLPAGFMRIRHYGLLANANREKLKRCRELLGVPVADNLDTEPTVTGSQDTVAPPSPLTAVRSAAGVCGLSRSFVRNLTTPHDETATEPGPKTSSRCARPLAP